MAEAARSVVGFALLGAGAGAEAHAAALAGLHEARLVAVADPVLERALSTTVSVPA